MAGVNISQSYGENMNENITIFLILISSLCIISCSNSEDPSGATSQLSQVLDQPNSTDDRNNIDVPVISLNSCYLIDSSTIDNSTVNTSSITDNSSIKDSNVKNCSAVVNSIVDNSSSIDNSTVTFSTINKSFVCAKSSIDNSTIDNSIVCDNSTIGGGSTVKNDSLVCNSTIDNSTIDNSTVCNSTFDGVSIIDKIVSDSIRPTVLSVSSENDNTTVYTQGGNISIKVTFSEFVFVDNSSGNPRIELETGSDDNHATYISGNSSNILTFLYIVESGDCAAILDYTGTDSLDNYNGSTIQDNSTNNAILTLPSPGSSGSLGPRNFNINFDNKPNRC